MVKIENISLKTIKNLISTYFLNVIDYSAAKTFLVQEKYISNSAKTENSETKIISAIAKLIYNVLLKDIAFIAQKDPSLKDEKEVIAAQTKGLIATMCYRVANFFYYCNITNNAEKAKQISRKLMEECVLLTSIDIHPAAKIKEQFFIDHGANIVIGATCVIGERCNIFNNVILGSKNVVSATNEKRHPTLKNDVTICAGAKILGNITLGNNVFVSPNAVVLDDVEDNQKVLIINQLQITKNETYSYLPSQKLIIYGIVPKFKNSLTILGEGFYNPTVLIKLKNNKEVTYNITYWDKNKILLKIKNTTPFDKESVKGVKIIILSNSNKVIVLNNVAIEKVLTTLTD